MKTAVILAELKTMIDPIQLGTLNILTSTKGSIVMCLCIARIIESYKSTQENEQRVSFLLSALCKNHFKTAVA